MKIGGNKGGGGKDFPKADPGKYVAVAAAFYDIGVQEITNTKTGETVLRERVALVWELDAQQPDGGPFTLVDDLPVSLFKSSKMREAAVALLDRPVDQDEELDTEGMLGKCALLTVCHSAKGNPYIDQRVALQDQSRALKVQGSYGPGDEIHGLVAWHMRKAEAGTVPPGQGVLPVKGAKPAQPAPQAQPQPQDTGGPIGQPEDGAQDDIPF